MVYKAAYGASKVSSEVSALNAEFERLKSELKELQSALHDEQYRRQEAENDKKAMQSERDRWKAKAVELNKQLISKTLSEDINRKAALLIEKEWHERYAAKIDPILFA